MAILSGGNLLSGPDGTVAHGRYFPEELTLFSIRAFAAFFASLSLASVTLVPARTLAPYVRLVAAGMFLLVPITVAALLNLWRFDFVGSPGGLLYLGAYVMVGVLSVVFLWWVRGRPDLVGDETA